MIDKYRQGRLPASAGDPGRLAGVAEAAVRRYRAAMDGYALHEGAFAAFSLVDAANEYIAETEPWTLARQGQQDRLTQVLSDVVEAVRIAAVLLLPVMPGSCAEILRRMGETRPVSDAAPRRRHGLVVGAASASSPRPIRCGRDSKRTRSHR